jgi:hypothetical protein
VHIGFKTGVSTEVPPQSQVTKVMATLVEVRASHWTFVESHAICAVLCFLMILMIDSFVIRLGFIYASLMVVQWFQTTESIDRHRITSSPA